MKKVSKIYKSDTIAVDMSIISHLEKVNRGEWIGWNIITKHTTWCQEADGYNNHIFLPKNEEDAFFKAFIEYTENN